MAKQSLAGWVSEIRRTNMTIQGIGSVVVVACLRHLVLIHKQSLKSGEMIRILWQGSPCLAHPAVVLRLSLGLLLAPLSYLWEIQLSPLDNDLSLPFVSGYRFCLGQSNSLLPGCPSAFPSDATIQQTCGKHHKEQTVPQKRSLFSDYHLLINIDSYQLHLHNLISPISHPVD